MPLTRLIQSSKKKKLDSVQEKVASWKMLFCLAMSKKVYYRINCLIAPNRTNDTCQRFIFILFFDFFITKNERESKQQREIYMVKNEGENKQQKEI